MNTYLILKWFHILSSVLMVGTGFGSAFYLFFINRTTSVEAQALVSRLVVRADWWFTTPTVILQPVSGLALAHLAGWPLDSPWIVCALVLYALAGLCWLPVVVLQLRMAAMAEQAWRTGTALPDAYHRHARTWTWLGIPAFTAMMVVYYLMVAKPALWA